MTECCSSGEIAGQEDVAERQKYKKIQKKSNVSANAIMQKKDLQWDMLVALLGKQLGHFFSFFCYTLGEKGT